MLGNPKPLLKKPWERPDDVKTWEMQHLTKDSQKFVTWIYNRDGKTYHLNFDEKAESIEFIAESAQ